MELVTKEYETFLQLVPSEQRNRSDEERVGGEGDQGSGADGKVVFEQYCQLLADEGFSPTVRKAFDLCYKPKPNSSTSPSSIFGLKISFGASPIYSAIPDVHVPYLALSPSLAGDPRGGADGSETFPFLYKIDLCFTPKAPIPTSFKVLISFNDGDSNTCKGTVDDISLDFIDLFLPVILPQQLQQVTGSPRVPE